MIIKNTGSFFVGHLEDRSVPEKDRAKLMSLANEEFADELADMLEEERKFEGVEELRALFWDKSDDLTIAITAALKHSLAYLKENGAPMYALTEQAAAYYAKNQKK